MTKRATLEIIAPSIEEATEKGLAELGLQPDQVEIEVLDEGSRGLFGLGSRQARIRLSVKSPHRPENAIPFSPTAGIEEAAPDEEQETLEMPEPAMPAADSPNALSFDDLALHIAHETISELLERMGITAEVEVNAGEVDDQHGRSPILIDIKGDDLGILIGRKAETLNALQYITSLMVSKQLGRSVSLSVDVEGYRERRRGQISQLALRMAEQAVRTGRKQTLEPMPANERRIVHMELRDLPDVKTESTGEEPNRKVTIIPV